MESVPPNIPASSYFDRPFVRPLGRSVERPDNYKYKQLAHFPRAQSGPTRKSCPYNISISVSSQPATSQQPGDKNGPRHTVQHDLSGQREVNPLPAQMDCLH